MSGPPDERELGEWIRTHTPRLLSLARAFAGDDVEAEDILQEVWMLAATRAHRRPAGTPIGAWLHTVTLNRGRSLLRRRRRREWLRAFRATEQPQPSVAGPDAGPDADEALLRARMWRAVAALPALQREVVLLRIVEDLSTRDAAERLGRAEGTVKASLHRALRTLRRALGDAEAPAARGGISVSRTNIDGVAR